MQREYWWTGFFAWLPIAAELAEAVDRVVAGAPEINFQVGFHSKSHPSAAPSCPAPDDDRLNRTESRFADRLNGCFAIQSAPKRTLINSCSPLSIYKYAPFDRRGRSPSCGQRGYPCLRAARTAVASASAVMRWPSIISGRRISTDRSLYRWRRWVWHSPSH